MKKILLTISLALAGTVGAQFSSGVVNLGSTGMTVKLETTATLATLTITGNSSSYLAIGFGAVGDGMADGTDGFIYNATANRDYIFNGIGLSPTPDGTQDWTQTSNTVSGSTRTVVATRSLAGGTGDTAIPNAAGSIPIFFARGGSTTIAQHSSTNRGYATLNMTATLGTHEAALAERKKVVLYPNPAKETVNFKNADKIKSIDIYESSGRKVKSVDLKGENISVSDLKSGSYYFEIILKDGTLSYEKLIKE